MTSSLQIYTKSQEEQWYKLHEDTEFTEEEFMKYREEKVGDVRCGV
jgi:hypothetical protein